MPAPLQLEKNTPLHMAVESNWRDISFYLIHNGADVNAENVLQRTPLHMAATHGRLEIGMMLLKGGSNPDKVRGPPAFACACACDVMSLSRPMLARPTSTGGTRAR